MPSLHHDPQRFQGWGNWIEHADIQQAKKDLSIFASPGWLQPFFFFLLSLSFIYYYAIPWPRCCVNTDKSKSSHKQVQLKLPLGQLPGNVIAQLGWPAPAQPPSQVPVQGMCPWAVNVSLCVQSLTSPLASRTQAGGCGGVGWAYAGLREPPRVISLSIYFFFLFLPTNSSSDNPMSPSPSCNYLKIFS